MQSRFSHFLHPKIRKHDRGSIPDWGCFFSSSPRPDRLKGPLSLLHNAYWGVLSPRVKRPGSEVDHSSLPSVEVKNARSYTSTTYFFMVWCLVKHRGDFKVRKHLHTVGRRLDVLQRGFERGKEKKNSTNILQTAILPTNNYYIIIIIIIIVVVVVVIILTRGTSPLEPVVHHTTHASSFRLYHFPYYVRCP
jgi:hypothetical protein